MDELEIPSLDTTPEPDSGPGPGGQPPQTVSIEEWMASGEPEMAEAPARQSLADAQLLAVLEAIVYIAEEPLTVAQIAAALDQEPDRIRALVARLVAEFDKPEHGMSIREVAGGYTMATKPEHHEAVRSFVKSLKAPLKLSLPALETLAVIAYKQPVTTPEIMEIRGVQGGGVLKTLLDRKLITEAGRKNVIGKPILYKTTKEFLIQFGLKDLSELPSLKEFEEIRRMAMADSEIPAGTPGSEQSELALEASATMPEEEAAVAEALAPETPDGEASALEAEAAAPNPEVTAAAAETPAGEASALEAEAAAPNPEVTAAAAETPAGEASALEAEAPAPNPEVTAAAAETPAGEASALEAEAPAPNPEVTAAAAETPVGEAAALEAEAAAPNPEVTAAAAETPAGEASDLEAEAPSPAPETPALGAAAAFSEAAAPMPEAEASEASVAASAPEIPAVEASATVSEAATPNPEAAAPIGVASLTETPVPVSETAASEASAPVSEVSAPVPVSETAPSETAAAQSPESQDH